MEKRVSALNELKVGSFVFVDGIPSKVVSLTHSKPGKHGAPKIRMEAVGIVDEKKRSMVDSADSRIDVPVIEKRNAQVVSISENKANCMDLDSYEMFDIEIPEEFKDKIKDGANILYWDVGVKLIKGVK